MKADLLARLLDAKIEAVRERRDNVASAIEDAIKEIQFLRRLTGPVSRGPDFAEIKAGIGSGKPFNIADDGEGAGD